MARSQLTEILKAIRGYSFGPGEVQELRDAIDCRAGRAKSNASAESALAAVYAAIEREAKGYDNAGVLSGLAELVNALKPRTPFPTSGQMYVNNDMNVTDLATVGAR
ncbi:hypothetical protein R3Q06_23055 [Rhodococcus erythropolis]|uniref:hypothetical protein n=1 Tax=Rhodococcus erythropolis TaxID=1833 RepID=UPI00294A061B|nr:hypothetical protein [Rhodococcus erythropolis]MDV6276382.1 hypothetical protein [Rhodococcus erythropolis]